jgi:hypothetical protein
MRDWLKRQWKENSNFRHAISVLVVIGLTAAGVPAQVGGAVGGIVSAVGA